MFLTDSNEYLSINIKLTDEHAKGMYCTSLIFLFLVFNHYELLVVEWGSMQLTSHLQGGQIKTNS